MKKISIIALALCLVGVIVWKSRAPEGPVVVVYTALDRIFSEPILKEFEKKTGIKVKAVYDTEAGKTVGLAGRIRREKNRPRCDVFWNNEILHTMRLKKEGLLQPYHADAAKAFPPQYRDPEGYWAGFAARARVLIVNTDLVSSAEMPDSIYDLADSRWKGKTAIAKPLFGTTASHAACLFSKLGESKARTFFDSLKKNEVKIEGGNKPCAVNVGAGRLAFALTDTDDALAEIENNSPVMIVYPDSQKGQLGVLFIPNTLALIKDAPHPDEGKRLIEYLLSPEVEAALARCSSSQIPLNPTVKEKPRVQRPQDVEEMEVDFGNAADAFQRTKKYIIEFFLK